MPKSRVPLEAVVRDFSKQDLLLLKYYQRKPGVLEQRHLDG
jgi:hypothetical protein